MPDTIEESLVTQKTRDLCQALVDQPEFRQIRQRIETFLADPSARNHYETVMARGDALQQKQQAGLPLNDAEILEFEKNRDLLLDSALARDFLEAQQQMHKIQESVMQYVGKTFELGRVPSAEDFPSGGCGPSCGCGH